MLIAIVYNIYSIADIVYMSLQLYFDKTQFKNVVEYCTRLYWKKLYIEQLNETVNL